MIRENSTIIEAGYSLAHNKDGIKNPSSNMVLSELIELIAREQVLSEMKIVKIGNKAPKYGWEFMAYKDKIWLVDPKEWKANDGVDLHNALVKELGYEKVPDPIEEEDYYGFSQRVNEELIDVFVGNYNPDNNSITASPMDSPSFRSSPLVKKVIKALGVSEVSYEGENESDSDFESWADTRDKLPDVFYHGTSSIFIEDILKKGLLPGKESNWTGEKYHGTFTEHVFVVDSPAHARWHAKNTANKRGGYPIVIEVKIPDKDKMTPDWDADSYSKSQKKTFKTVNKSPNQLSTVGSWKTSKHTGRFGYKGRIPASHIRVFTWSPTAEYDDNGWEERYPGDEYIWKQFEKYLKQGDLDTTDAWQYAVEGEDDFEEGVLDDFGFEDEAKPKGYLTERYQELTVGDDDYADGYTCSVNDENLKNWLYKVAKPKDRSRIVKVLTEKIGSDGTVAILKNMWVDEDNRGQGIGTDLVYEFLEESAADVCLLEADILETQKPGFNLTKFYESLDFEKIADGINAPIMIWYANHITEGLTEATGRPGGWIGPVYHGSRHKFLKKLDVGQNGTGTVMSRKSDTPAIFFTSSKENAAFYTDPKGDDDPEEYIYSAYVKLNNPMVVSDEDPMWKKGITAIAAKARKDGHDGFIVKDYQDGSEVSNIYGVFNNKNARIVGPLKEPDPNLGSDKEINEDDIEVVCDDGECYVYFHNADDEVIMGPGPYKNEDAAKKEGLRLVRLHNASL